MKRSFRVATVFTGAAACAAALAPAALAAPGAPATGPTAHNCNSTNPADSFAVHLYYTASEHHPTPACIGNGVGEVEIGAGKRFVGYCGGSNSGFFSIDRMGRKFTAGAAKHALFGASVVAVGISRPGHSTFNCPTSWSIFG